ncbi:MFS transporter [Burkholderia sp. Ac-20384]|uniref:MFS transporter n=1 Tax=Burkholderia sp. Ac-20384 TaxID=2703902 RepID=UPI0019825641|nr:MFS transporter [Burkholderia sp. Ac-20384]MBN3824779.1 MFS transporter [Burkholderia sp. Ac-20384]
MSGYRNEVGENQKNVRARDFLRSVRADFVSLPRDVRTLLFAQFFLNVSTFMAFPLMAVYMARGLHFSATEIGTVLTIHLIGARALPIVTGPLSDRFGFCVLMVSGLALRAAGFIGFGAVSSFSLITVATLAIGLGTSLYESAVYGIFGRQVTDLVPRVFVLNNLLLNLGVVAGPMLGALLVSFNPVAPFFVSGALFAAMAIWCIRFGHLDSLYPSRSSFLSGWQAVTRDRVFLLFLLATSAWWFLFSQLFVLFPIIAARLTGSEAGASAVFTANGIAGLVFVGASLLVFKIVSRHQVLLWSYAFLAVLYPLAGLGDGFGWLLAVVVAYTFAETMILPAIESLTAELAHEGKQATFFGAVGLSWGISGGIGNYVGSWLAISQRSPMVIWGTLTIVALVGVALAACFNAASKYGRTLEAKESSHAS